MRCALVLALGGYLLISSYQACAQQGLPATPLPKRNMADCMLRRMSAEKTLSYNDAAKLCKEQLKSIKPVSAANTTGKPVG